MSYICTNISGHIKYWNIPKYTEKYHATISYTIEKQARAYPLPVLAQVAQYALRQGWRDLADRCRDGGTGGHVSRVRPGRGEAHLESEPSQLAER